eukprot:4565993-Prymnesium_polylepis.1
MASLLQLIQEGDPGRVGEWLAEQQEAAHAFVNHVDPQHGATPLMLASALKDDDACCCIAEELISAGAHLNTGAGGTFPLFLAAREGRVGLVRLLLQH